MGGRLHDSEFYVDVASVPLSRGEIKGEMRINKNQIVYRLGGGEGLQRLRRISAHRTMHLSVAHVEPCQVASRPRRVGASGAEYYLFDGVNRWVSGLRCYRVMSGLGWVILVVGVFVFFILHIFVAAEAGAGDGGGEENRVGE